MTRTISHALAILAVTALTASAASAAFGDSAEISANGTRKSLIGSDQHFTGTVIIDPLYGARENLPQTGGVVTFAPGARSAWHSHPAGQILIVTSGTGWVQEDGGARREIRPGDVVWTPPGVKHWHGATTSTAMSHIALSNMRDGKNVVWMEQVSDAHYSGQ